jgi:hypothetical protein
MLICDNNLLGGGGMREQNIAVPELSNRNVCLLTR